MKISSPEYDPGDAVWRKSSYSGGEGGNCLEVATSSKSARSGAGGDCLDAAADRPGAVPVRDSKNPDGPKLVFRTAAWSAFVDGVSDAPQTGR
ncbi:DUF397 domain-containing protein [Streptomyces tirandamycinicus]|uniref:DUF397 domain-containing protein n=1 Tax=Streptomyces tirandamycinicus TaxID=2174846 RepID=UPI0022718939|nr:DUF397 domain-containing protein [Streptomyces tirandamycinicus]MCY0980167.1 DUF397 domain-containing protein [Streptomyces tirandamycinicus]